MDTLKLEEEIRKRIVRENDNIVDIDIFDKCFFKVITISKNHIATKYSGWIDSDGILVYDVVGVL